jgi:uncharacterized damage-inducible protein DinB
MPIARPAPGEFNPYYSRYLDLLGPDADPVDLLERGEREIHDLLSPLGDERARYRYAPGKWSIKEMVVHVTDTERIFACRLLRIARGDTTPMPGFEQDDYAPASEADRRSLADILAEYHAVRSATLALAGSLSAEALARQGTASESVVSARALVYIMAGHERHHLRMLREKYGV